MGILSETHKLNLLVYGKDKFDNFKNNSLYFFNKMKSSDDEFRSIRAGQIQLGRFYHFHYMDESNWMRYCPVFTVDAKKYENKIIVFAINLNFIPIELRITIFDRFIDESMIEKDQAVQADYQSVYNELKKYGFEWAIFEYNLSQFVMVHRINLKSLARFLYSGHPINKYDPQKLFDIWQTKLKTRDEREKAIIESMVDDFVDIEKQISKDLSILKNHITRTKRNIDKFGK